MTQIQALLQKAIIGSVAIDKGRDFAFSGAVDNLVINADTFNFEPLEAPRVACSAD